MVVHEKQKTNNKKNNENLPNNLSLKCWPRKNDHKLMDCPSFKDSSPFKRRQFVKEKNLSIV